MATPTTSVITARNRLVGLYSRGVPDPAALVEAKRNLTIAHAERAIQAVRDAEPPLLPEQLEALAAKLLGSSK